MDSVHQAHGGVAAAPNFSEFSLLSRLISPVVVSSVSVRPPGQVNSQHHALRAASSIFVPTSRPIFFQLSLSYTLGAVTPLSFVVTIHFQHTDLLVTRLSCTLLQTM